MTGFPHRKSCTRLATTRTPGTPAGCRSARPRQPDKSRPNGRAASSPNCGEEETQSTAENDFPMRRWMSSRGRRHWSPTPAWRETVPVVWLDSAELVVPCICPRSRWLAGRHVAKGSLSCGNAYLHDWSTSFPPKTRRLVARRKPPWCAWGAWTAETCSIASARLRGCMAAWLAVAHATVSSGSVIASRWRVDVLYRAVLWQSSADDPEETNCGW